MRVLRALDVNGGEESISPREARGMLPAGRVEKRREETSREKNSCLGTRKTRMELVKDVWKQMNGDFEDEEVLT